VRILFLGAVLASALALSASAQGLLEHGTFFVGGGPSFPENRLGTYTKDGYNISVGGGVKANRIVEFLGEFDFIHLGVEKSVLRALSVPQGTTRVYALTANVKLNVIPAGPLHVYVIGGGGWYRRTVEFTQPTTALVTVFDPWWGYFANAVVPANQVFGSVTRDSGGFNAGGGISFAVGHGTRIYAESRWHRAYHSPTNTTIVPVTFGLRF
jgi:opacity protein-like surface antigen